MLARILMVLLFSYIFTGCEFTHYLSKEERIVSDILQSQRNLYQASSQTTILETNDIYRLENIYHDRQLVDGIQSLKLHIGNAFMRGYQNDRLTMSDVSLDFDLDTRTHDYVYDYKGYIYDEYHDRYYFNTSIPFVGNATINPYKGLLEIEGQRERIIVQVLDAYSLDISVYDDFDSYQDRVIHTTWKELGL